MIEETLLPLDSVAFGEDSLEGHDYSAKADRMIPPCD